MKTLRFIVKYYNGRCRFGTIDFETENEQEIKDTFFEKVIEDLKERSYQNDTNELEGIFSIRLQEDFNL